MNKSEALRTQQDTLFSNGMIFECVYENEATGGQSAFSKI